jgi:multicomponent Na+:H+ antiporter subunit C
MIYGLGLLLFAIGLYGVLVKKNLVKIIIGLATMEIAVILMIVMLGYGDGAADPVTHDLAVIAVLTAGAVIAVAIGLAKRLHTKHGTYDLKEINRFKS